jgi:hypothetical protein
VCFCTKIWLDYFGYGASDDLIHTIGHEQGYETWISLARTLFWLILTELVQK